MKKIILLFILALQSFFAYAQIEPEAIQEIPINKIYLIDSMPEYPGGTQAMYQFIKDSLIYPDSARNNGIEGRVVCQFVVDKDGSLTDIEVVHSSGDTSLDEEAVRIIGLMPKWKPGIARKQPARIRMTLPLNFKLK